MRETREMKRCLIQVFARLPEPGKVKTRLIPAIGAEGAAVFAAERLQTTLAAASQIEAADTEFWYSGSNAEFLADCTVTTHAQPETDLGERMRLALTDGQRRSERVVLVGTDCPMLDEHYLASALMLLSDHPVVLGPAEDGGYGLIGVSGPVPDIFSNIDWGTASVLRDTCQRLNQASIHYALMPLIWDVDRPADLDRYAAWSGNAEPLQARSGSEDSVLR